MIQTGRDRIGDVYEGNYGNEEFQERTRKRVNWICEQTVGEDILDVGCSQGIVRLLLAREGKNVLAIDINAENIAYAEEHLANEPADIQKRVQYLCADFLNYDLQDAAFDCILLTEVLEHLEAPEACLEKISGLLRPDGQVLVMVPFGINPHPDHKRTYYFLDLLHSMQTYFQPAAVDFMGSWIAIRAYSQQGERTEGIPIDEELIRRIEESFFHIDSAKQRSINQLKNRLNRVNAEAEKLTKENEALDNKYKMLSKVHETLISENTVLSSTYEALAGEHEALVGENKALFRAHEALTNAHETLSNTHEVLFNAHEALTSEHKMLSNAHEALVRAHETLSDQYRTLVTEYENLTNKEKNLQEKQKVLNDKVKNLTRRYEVLSKSKFGRLQIRWWTYRGNRRRAKAARREKWKNQIREFVFSHPLLTKVYMKFRPFIKKFILPHFESPKTANSVAPKGFKVPEWGYVPQAEFEEKTDRSFFQRVKPLIDALPESNGCRYYERSQLKIGIVADRFFLDSIKDAADFLFLTPDHWEKQIQEIDFLLMVSAWRGLDEEWRGAAKPNSDQQTTIFKIIAACKERGIPSVFYSKEDPPNYDLFLPIAQHSDIVFTTCEEVVEKYRKDCETQQIYVLPFGINPLMHNPIGMRNPNKQPGVIFSGSWMNKYPERCKDMRLLMDGVMKADVPLKIVDRNYRRQPTYYRFPPEYWHGISPSMDHDDLQKLHKLYDWALDINTVKDSLTMFANRGYELQASGSLQISNYSAGVNDKLPFVFIANEQQEVVEILKHMQPEEIYRRQIEGVRAMMTGETCFDRLGALASAAGVSLNQPTRRVAVIADRDTPRIRDMFERQTYPEKTLLFAGSVTPEELERYDMAAFFAEEMDYEIFYLEDMVNGFKYTACDYITKDAYWIGDELHTGTEHDYVDRMESKYRTLFWREAFQPQALLTMEDGQELPNGYSIDHFNYNAQKPQEKPVPDGLLISVVVPVYNNGHLLMAKCFASLQRSTMFNKMHIFLVDDGSTDGKTQNIVRYLERTYSNVTAYFFDDGGSGSASRPRNKGVQMADTDYVTFLDPDDEVVNDAYTAMYAMLKETSDGIPYDVVLGESMKCTNQINQRRYYNYDRLGCADRGSDVYNGDMRQLLMESNLVTVSIQAMLIRRSMLVENHLEQVPGAVGEDTLFGWEVLAHARSIRITRLTAHIYYSMTSNSVTNSIGKRYFEKCRLIEEPRRKFLRQHDLLQFYAEHRYNYYFTGWVLKALCRAKPEDEEACTQIVYEMHKMYLDCYDGNSPVINEFAMYCNAGQYDQALAYIRQANQERKL